VFGLVLSAFGEGAVLTTVVPVAIGSEEMSGGIFPVITFHLEELDIFPPPPPIDGFLAEQLSHFLRDVELEVLQVKHIQEFSPQPSK